MVAIKRHPTLPLEAAIRLMHPFPIFERYVPINIYCPSTKQQHHERSSTPPQGNPSLPQTSQEEELVVPAGSQVVIFTSDFLKSEYSWNVFGSGPRMCAGMHIALPFLRILHKKFLDIPTDNSTSKLSQDTLGGQGNLSTVTVEITPTSARESLFCPEVNHRYSGRNNDSNTSPSEIVYLLYVVCRIYLVAIFFGLD
jgi:hypothetical protein